MSDLQVKNDRGFYYGLQRLSFLPDYYDLVVFGIHHFGISSICYGKQMPKAEREATMRDLQG